VFIYALNGASNSHKTANVFLFDTVAQPDVIAEATYAAPIQGNSPLGESNNC